MIYALIILVVLAVLMVGIYNRLITLRNRAKEALSDIDVQSKRRYDLIPNLVETVKGYATHEKSVLENVTAARTSAMSASGNPLEKAKSEDALSGTLKTLFAVSENYPELKANVNFLELQRELSDTENKMMAARRFYNSTVNDLNTAVMKFPTNLLAGMFGFHEEKFFEVASVAEKEPVKVSF
ncbi:MAG: LemA family protein [Candidatus Liptonbacteria bacterium]